MKTTTSTRAIWVLGLAGVAALGLAFLPSLLPTGIHASQRNRPSTLSDTVAPAAAYDERVRQGMAASPIDATDVAAATLAAVRAGRFYVIPHSQTGGSVRRRMNAILDDFGKEHPEAG